MSWYAIAWAEKAPVGTVYERALLTYLAHRAKKDGTNAYPSTRTLADFALCDKRTAARHLNNMVKRGLIAEGDQSVAGHLRADRRPTVYDLLIPYEWYSDDQRQEVNEERAERELPPLTTEARPRLTSAPEKSRRVDAGVPNPKRGKTTGTSAQTTGCLSGTPSEVVDNSSRGVSQTSGTDERGVSQTQSGVSLCPPKLSERETDRTNETSPPLWVPVETARERPSRSKGEGELPQIRSNPSPGGESSARERVASFLRSVLAQVPSELRSTVSRSEREPLIDLVMAAEAAGLDHAAIRTELSNTYGTRDLSSAWPAKLRALTERAAPHQQPPKQHHDQVAHSALTANPSGQTASPATRQHAMRHIKKMLAKASPDDPETGSAPPLAA